MSASQPLRSCLLLLALLAAPALSQKMDIAVEVPRLQVAEYHNPYVAIWLQDEKNQVAANLAVWYDLKLKNEEGEKWLKDMRLWWRRAGRRLDMPVDGLSGATRGPGRHHLKFTGAEKPLSQLEPGEYRLMVEASREVGGREVVEIPFTWPPQQNRELSAGGDRELGVITLQLVPANN